MNDTQTGFPKYQFSVFVGEGRNAPQIVFRSNEIDEFKGMLEELEIIKTLIPEQPVQKALPMGEGNSDGKVCARCGEPAQERRGVGKNTGKPYHALFCSSGEKSHTVWL